MKTILSWRRHHYIARFGIFLITAALIAGMVGCGTAAQYTLSVSSTWGGAVTYPGIGTFTYPIGAVVLLEATPAEGYGFTYWSGDVSTVADVNSPTTSITMNGHYSITANFAYGHFIRTWYDLDEIRDDLSGYCILMKNLDAAIPGYEELAGPTADGGEGWQPIRSFNGTFDGQGYEIRDLFINRPDEYCVGLFGVVEEGGVIKNVGVVDAGVTGDAFVGGLVGDNEGSVNNSYAIGNVIGSSNVGGLVGDNEGVVSDSYSTGSVTGVTGGGKSGDVIGGLVGFNEGTVSNCYSTGSVAGSYYVGGLVGMNKDTLSTSHSNDSVTGWCHVGGFVGQNYYGTVSNSYSTGSVTGDEYVGGLIGDNYNGTVTNSYAIGNVTGDENVGGLIGDNYNGTVTNSYTTGTVSGNIYHVGGLVGFNGGDVSNSYSTGSVTGDEYVGGLIGENEGSVNNSYSTGNVIGSSNVGGLVGCAFFGTVSDSFWDTDTSGQSTSAGGTGKTTLQMQDITTFSGIWDIIDVDNSNDRDTGYIWNIVHTVTYPFLSWQPVS